MDRRSLWLGAPGCDDAKRSPDEVRIIHEMTSQEVEIFLQANNIDVAAAKELRNEPPHVALAVLERGSLRACVNPSGALVARIRDAKRGILGDRGRYGGVVNPASLDANASELDRFLAENRIDQAGTASLRSESAEVQKAVMARGALVNTTNPSASLMARIRTVKMNAAQGLQPGQGGLNPAPGGLQAGPMPGMPGLPSLPTPPPPNTSSMLALEDSRAGAAPGSVIAADLGDEARKAIMKLNAGGASPTQATAGAVAPSFENGGSAHQDTTSASITNTEDKRLQDEALKAIQQLNAGS